MSNNNKERKIFYYRKILMARSKSKLHRLTVIVGGLVIVIITISQIVTNPCKVLLCSLGVAVAWSL